MKIMVVDDEPLARSRLVQLVASIPDIHAVIEAENGRQALERHEKDKVHIVLLDIRMPVMDGLEAGRHFAALDEPPAIIFTTAYGEHALEAFDAYAAGYLLKPVQKGALIDAIGAAKRMTRAQEGRGFIKADKNCRSHICVRARGSLKLIEVKQVLYFRADAKYVEVCTSDTTVLIEESLKLLEAEFTPHFMRVHRNALVQVAAMVGLDRHADGKFCVRLKGSDEQIEVSRRHLSSVRAHFRG